MAKTVTLTTTSTVTVLMSAWPLVTDVVRLGRKLHHCGCWCPQQQRQESPVSTDIGMTGALQKGPILEERN